MIQYKGPPIEAPPLLNLLQQPGPKKFKLFKKDVIYKAKKFKVPPLAI